MASLQPAVTTPCQHYVPITRFQSHAQLQPVCPRACGASPRSSLHPEHQQTAAGPKKQEVPYRVEATAGSPGTAEPPQRL